MKRGMNALLILGELPCTHKKQNQIFNFQCICSHLIDQMKNEATLPNHTKQCQRFSVRSKNKKIKRKSNRNKTTETYRKNMNMNMK